MSHYNNPPDKWKPTRVEQVNNLFDLLSNDTGWVTRQQIADYLEMSHKSVDRVVRDLRITLGVSDSITVVARINKGGGYRLVGRYEDAAPWATGRIADAETRIETLQFSMSSVVKATDGRTVEGKKARLVEMSMRHLLEQLLALDSQI